MSQADRRTTHNCAQLNRLAGRAAARLAMSGVLALLPLGLVGCTETDSFIDQSVLGRWEHTPTIMPVLDRIAAIEDNTGEAVEYSDPTPDDLIPVAMQYRIGPGDLIDILAYDLVEPGKPELYEVIVDSRGGLDVPQLGHFNVQGLTADDVQAQVAKAMERLVPNPLVQVQVKQQRQQTFTLIGSITTPGPYFIPKPDYRLLEAVTAGGPFNQDVEYVYVIRQVPLSEAVSGQGPATGVRPPRPGDQQQTPPNILDIIKDLSPEPKPNTQPANPAPQPGAEPKPAGEKGVLDLIDQIAPEKPKADPANPPKPDGSPAAFASRAQPPGDAPAPPPAIDLPQTRPGAQPAPGQPSSEPASTSWVFLNGKWVQVSRAPKQGAGPSPSGANADELVTQRVIRIPMQDLIQGRQAVNVVVRPGDVVRVPFPPSGLVFMAGHVARVGPISIPADGLTLLRAIDSAGGLSGLAIPERVDLQRMIGHDRQATIRLNLRAIAEQTQPDLRLKTSDRINVGTNFWAYPIAVVRNGMRSSYGFGFLLDRNFGNDVFGVPPGTPGFR